MDQRYAAGEVSSPEYDEVRRATASVCREQSAATRHARGDEDRTTSRGNRTRNTGVAVDTRVAQKALRLLRIGHGEAQGVLRRSHAVIERAVDDAETVPWNELRPFAPRLDLATARHERSSARLFAS